MIDHFFSPYRPSLSISVYCTVCCCKAAKESSKDVKLPQHQFQNQIPFKWLQSPAYSVGWRLRNLLFNHCWFIPSTLLLFLAFEPGSTCKHKLISWEHLAPLKNINSNLLLKHFHISNSTILWCGRLTSLRLSTLLFSHSFQVAPHSLLITRDKWRAWCDTIIEDNLQ